MTLVGSTMSRSPDKESPSQLRIAGEQPSFGDASLSPTNSLPTTILDNCETCLVSAIVLCYWDNILGPRIKHLWLPKEMREEYMSDTLRYIATHTLGGEICRDPTDCHVDTKYFVMKERGVGVSTFVFGAWGHGDYGVHSLSLVIPIDVTKKYLQWHDLCRSWLLQDVARLRVLMDKEENDSFQVLITPYIRKFIMMLNSLSEASMPTYISDGDTDMVFHARSVDEKSFVSRAITSHLVTCGCSLVVGKRTSKVNAMLTTLALFLSPSERKCSRFVKHDKTWPYCPDLFLQAALQSSSGSLDIPLRDIQLSQYPSTLVDLTACTVKFTGFPHQHALTRHSTVSRQLAQLWCGHGDTLYPLSDMFHVFDEAETLVTNLVEELSLLPPNTRLLETYVGQFMNCLDRKALALTHYVDVETSHGKNPGKLSGKRLRHDLSLKVPGDFYIVLARAEKLKPGIYEFVMGDAEHN